MDPLIPKGLWRVITTLTILLFIVGGCSAVVLVFVPTYANLLPEGALSTSGSQAQTTQQSGSGSTPSQGSTQNISATPTDTSGEELLFPYKCKAYITQGTHRGRNGPYQAMDLANRGACPDLRSPITGKVEKVTPKENDGAGYGNNIIISNSTYRIRMAHCADRAGKTFTDLKVGDSIQQGSPVCTEGTTGNSTGLHLHIEIYKHGMLVKPWQVFPCTAKEKDQPAAGSDSCAPTEQMLQVMNGAPSQATAHAPVPAPPTPPNALQNIFIAMADLGSNTKDLPGRITGNGTSKDATIGTVRVIIEDTRVNRSKKMPGDLDARTAAEMLSKAIPTLKDTIRVKFVDGANTCDDYGCFYGNTIPPYKIENAPTTNGNGWVVELSDAMPSNLWDTVVGHEFGHIKDIQERGTPPGKLAEDTADRHQQIYFENITKTESSVMTSASSTSTGDSLIVYVFLYPAPGKDATKPGGADEDGEKIKKQIEPMKQLYPWVDFIYLDVTKQENRRHVVAFQVTETPTTVLTRGGRNVWKFKGRIDGLSGMLDDHAFLSKQVFLSGNVPFITGQTPDGQINKVTFALQYGSFCNAKGSIGVLGKGISYPNSVVGVPGQTYPCSAQGALDLAASWGKWVGEHNGGRPVINVFSATHGTSNKAVLKEVIELTGQKNAQGEHWYVLIDEPGHSEDAIKRVMDEYIMYPHVGYTLDLEWFGRRVPVSELNRIASYYFEQREVKGVKGLGIIGVWYFNPNDLNPDEKLTDKWDKDGELQSNQSTGIIVPLMDGIGGAGAKLSTYKSMMDKFGAKYGGMMGFRWRWGNRFESSNEMDYFRPEQLFWAQQ